jgi:hypothetical protein
MHSCIIFLCIIWESYNSWVFKSNRYGWGTINWTTASHQFWFLISVMHIKSSLWLAYNNNSLVVSEIISSHLGKLENLDLSYNMFNDIILSHLQGFSSLLSSLNLSTNMLLGSTLSMVKLWIFRWYMPTYLAHFLTILFKISKFFRQFVVYIALQKFTMYIQY